MEYLNVVYVYVREKLKFYKLSFTFSNFNSNIAIAGNSISISSRRYYKTKSLK